MTKVIPKALPTVAAVLGAVTLLAAPAEKVDPVAPGFPVWTGVTAKNYVFGRELTPSDLRHKATILLEVDVTDKLQEQLIMAGGLMGRSSVTTSEGAVSENWEVPRTYVAVISCRGLKSKEPVEAALTPKKGDKDMSAKLRAYGRNSSACPIYSGVSYEGAPDTTGKRPYVYVFGPTGAEPIFHGTLTAETLKSASAAADKAAKEIRSAEPPWKPFFGTVEEPKFNTTLKKTLEKGKTAKKAPLDPVSKALLADVKSKDEEKAREAQILFDAIAQTRSDLVLKIRVEASGSPHLAYRDIQKLLKYWPAEAKRIEVAVASIRARPEFDMMGKAFVKMTEWGDPSFACKNASEAKKIVAELKKIKKALAGVKESQNITVQNCALLIDMKAEELISLFQSKAEVK